MFIIISLGLKHSKQRNGPGIIDDINHLMSYILGRQLEKYEAMYGKILSPEEIKSREKEYLNLKSKGPDDLESLNKRKKILA
jgi:hypothetical protein